MTRPSRKFDLSPQRLRHIRWIGGGTGAGKSIVAGRLSEKYGFRLYHCDDMQSTHTIIAVSGGESIDRLATRVAQCLGIGQ